MLCLWFFIKKCTSVLLYNIIFYYYYLTNRVVKIVEIFVKKNQEIKTMNNDDSADESCFPCQQQLFWSGSNATLCVSRKL